MSLFKSKSALLACATAVSLSFAACPALAQSADKPGEGVSVTPLKSSIAEETFQTLLVSKALEELGYDVGMDLS